MDKAVETPLVDLLRRVHPEATAEIAEPGGWTYYTFGLGRTMHRAADEIERLQKQLPRLGSMCSDIIHSLRKVEGDMYCKTCGERLDG
jgi:hypothetical protein